jgi:hypothetical protein
MLDYDFKHLKENMNGLVLILKLLYTFTFRSLLIGTNDKKKKKE